MVEKGGRHPVWPPNESRNNGVTKDSNQRTTVEPGYNCQDVIPQESRLPVISHGKGNDRQFFKLTYQWKVKSWGVCVCL